MATPTGGSKADGASKSTVKSSTSSGKKKHKRTRSKSATMRPRRSFPVSKAKPTAAEFHGTSPGKKAVSGQLPDDASPSARSQATARSLRGRSAPSGRGSSPVPGGADLQSWAQKVDMVLHRLIMLGRAEGVDNVTVSMWLSHHGGSVERAVESIIGKAEWNPSSKLENASPYGFPVAESFQRPGTAPMGPRLTIDGLYNTETIPTFTESSATLTQRLSHTWFGLKELYAHHEMHKSLVENANPRVQTQLPEEVRHKRSWLKKKARKTTAAKMIKEMDLPDTLAYGADLQKVLEWRRRRQSHEREMSKCGTSLTTRLPDHVTRYKRQRALIRNKALQAGKKKNASASRASLHKGLPSLSGPPSQAQVVSPQVVEYEMEKLRRDFALFMA